jgi:hypothetical protein
MGLRHGKDGIVKVGANTVTETKRWTLRETVDTADSTAQGDAAKKHIAGIPGWDGTAVVLMDKADTTGQGALTIGASVTLNLYDDGTTTGAKYHSGTATVHEIGRTVDMGSVVEISFSFLGNGALTHPTVP